MLNGIKESLFSLIEEVRIAGSQPFPIGEYLEELQQRRNFPLYISLQEALQSLLENSKNWIVLH